jgi:hypothetical protein
MSLESSSRPPETVDRECRPARNVPIDDESLASALKALDEALEEGDIEEMERLKGLLGAMHRLRAGGEFR